MLPRRIKYLIVGSANTVVGYFVGVLAYKFLFDLIGIWMVGLISNILGISFSFVTYKAFVFKTPGNWWCEYVKSYVVYGAMALVGMVLLWFFVGRLGINIWFAQGLAISCTVLLSYIGHKEYTFKARGEYES